MKNKILEIIKYKENHGNIDFDTLGVVSSSKPKTLTFCERNDYALEALKNKNISVILTTIELFKTTSFDEYEKSIIVVENPKFEFWKLHNYIVENEIFGIDLKPFRGINIDIHETAYIDKNTYIGNNVKVGPHSVVLSGTIIGDNSVIHSNCTIGAEGLQTVIHDNEKLFIKHLGGVKIGENVQILSNSVVSKAVDQSFTQIDDDTAVSLLCSIGHNCKVGKNCNIAGNVLIGGSAIIGNNVWIGPSSTIKDSIKINDNAQIKLGSVVVKDVKEKEEVSGNFAYSHAKRIRNFAKEQR